MKTYERPLTKYEFQRNQLIPEAVRYADIKAGKEPKAHTYEHDNWCVIWNLTFHRRMNVIAKEAGLTGGK